MRIQRCVRVSHFLFSSLGKGSTWKRIHICNFFKPSVNLSIFHNKTLNYIFRSTPKKTFTPCIWLVKIDNIWLDDISAPSVERLGSILLANRTSILVLLNRFSSRQCKLNRFNIFTRAISKFKILILMLRVNHKTEITVYRLVWDWERCLSKISNSMSPCLLFRLVELKMTNEKAPKLGEIW